MTTAGSDGVQALVDVLGLEPSADGRFSAQNLTGAGNGRVVFGGQILAQIAMAGALRVPDKSVKSLHAMFVRGADPAVPLTIDVEVLHSGRMYAQTSVTIGQPTGLNARALVLLDAPDTELAHHAEPAPDVDGPEQSSGGEPRAGEVGETRIVGGVDLGDPSETGPPELFVWRRFPGAPDDDSVSRSLLAYASEPLLFPTALRPHKGLSQALSYTEIIPAVITHSITYHDRFDASDWLLLALRSPHVGRGRIFGTGNVFTRDGRLVASITQENQLRPVRHRE